MVHSRSEATRLDAVLRDWRAPPCMHQDKTARQIESSRGLNGSPDMGRYCRAIRERLERGVGDLFGELFTFAIMMERRVESESNTRDTLH